MSTEFYSNEIFTNPVNNLHGMPGLLGAVISVIMAGIASSDSYDQFSADLPEDEKR